MPDDNNTTFSGADAFKTYDALGNVTGSLSAADRSPYDQQLQQALGTIGQQARFTPWNARATTGAEGQLWQGLGQQRSMMNAQANRRGFDPSMARAASYAGGEMQSRGWGMTGMLRAQQEAQRRQQMMEAMQARSQAEGGQEQLDLQKYLNDYNMRLQEAQREANIHTRNQEQTGKLTSAAISMAGSAMGGYSDARAKKEAYLAGAKAQDDLIRSTLQTNRHPAGAEWLVGEPYLREGDLPIVLGPPKARPPAPTIRDRGERVNRVIDEALKPWTDRYAAFRAERAPTGPMDPEELKVPTSTRLRSQDVRTLRPINVGRLEPPEQFQVRRLPMKYPENPYYEGRESPITTYYEHPKVFVKGSPQRAALPENQQPFVDARNRMLRPDVFVNPETGNEQILLQPRVFVRTRGGDVLQLTPGEQTRSNPSGIAATDDLSAPPLGATMPKGFHGFLPRLHVRDTESGLSVRKGWR